MALYEKFTYDLGDLVLKEQDTTELESEFDGSGEYLVCSDEMADNNAKGAILSNLWAFRADFLAGETGLPSEAFSCMQEKMSENCNEAVRALVKSTCGEDSLVDAAVSADGRGHFLAPYDNEEISYVTKSGKTIYLYRCN